MVSELKVNKISPATGTETTLGDASDKFIVPSGAELEVASGATITNLGTATNFGGGGAMIFLERQTATTASTVDFDGNFTSDYTNYILYFSNVYMSTDAQIRLQVRQSDTAMTNHYYCSTCLMNHRSSGSNSTDHYGSFNDLNSGYLHRYNIEGNVAEPCAGHLYIYNPLDATGGKCFTGNFVTQLNNNSTNNQNISVYWDENTNALSGINIITSAGTVSGIFDLFGVTNS